MKHFEVVGINHPAYQTMCGARFAVACITFNLRYTQMFAPVFTEKFPAEVFAAAFETGKLASVETQDDELTVAHDIAAFILTWDEKHGDDDAYPTPDGKYPKAALMAQWFLEARTPGVVLASEPEVLAAVRVQADLGRSIRKVFGL